MNFMKEAIKEAKKAYNENEVPVGAVLVCDNEIIASAHNRCESLCDNTAHAEMLAIREALKKRGEKQLCSCELYVTMEPCAMCTGAILNTKLKRVYIGCMEPKTGCMGSVTDLSRMTPWKPEVYYGFCEDECRAVMQEFFADKRI